MGRFYLGDTGMWVIIHEYYLHWRWSEEKGWVGVKEATRYIEEEKAFVRMPEGGRWKRV